MKHLRSFERRNEGGYNSQRCCHSRLTRVQKWDNLAEFEDDVRETHTF